MSLNFTTLLYTERLIKNMQWDNKKTFGFGVKFPKRDWQIFGVTLEHPTMDKYWNILQ